MQKNNKKDSVRTVKDSIVLTPPVVSDYIYNDLKRKVFKNVLDIGCNRGNLSKPFRKKANAKIIGLDIEDTYRDNFEVFIHKDFLETTKEDFEGLNIDLIVLNPPFQHHKGHKELYPHLFYKHILSLFGNIPTVMIAGAWYLSNSSKRMEDFKAYNITKITTLHKSVFNTKENHNISIEASILYFNIKTRKAHDFLDKGKKEKPTRKFRTVALNKSQSEFLEKQKIKNFNDLIKKLLKSEFEGFPE
jgi:23S rRNA U2552 (ribose-2'-O)-methylase RlmE/FtsJ